MTDDSEFAENEEMVRLRLRILQAMNHGAPLKPHDATGDEFDRLRAFIDSGDARRLIQEQAAPLGEFMIACSDAQSALSTTLATVLNPVDPTRIRPILAGMPVSVMIGQLERALPPRAYYRTFLKKAAQVFKNRNAAAHSRLTAFRVEYPSIRYGLWLVGTGGKYVEIPEHGGLAQWKAEASLIAASATAATVLESGAVKFPPHATFREIVLIASEFGTNQLNLDSITHAFLRAWYPDRTSRLSTSPPPDQEDS